jgi:hypothetical protein
MYTRKGDACKGVSVFKSILLKYMTMYVPQGHTLEHFLEADNIFQNEYSSQNPIFYTEKVGKSKIKFEQFSSLNYLLSLAALSCYVTFHRNTA